MMGQEIPAKWELVIDLRRRTFIVDDLNAHCVYKRKMMWTPHFWRLSKGPSCLLVLKKQRWSFGDCCHYSAKGRGDTLMVLAFQSWEWRWTISMGGSFKSSTWGLSELGDKIPWKQPCLWVIGEKWTDQEYPNQLKRYGQNTWRNWDFQHVQEKASKSASAWFHQGPSVFQLVDWYTKHWLLVFTTKAPWARDLQPHQGHQQPEWFKRVAISINIGYSSNSDFK